MLLNESIESRKVIRDIPTLTEELPTWIGKRFAFDVETSGLSFRKDRLLGLALYFEDNRSYYIVLEHTQPLWNNLDAVVTTFIGSKLLAFLMSSLFSQHDVLMVAHNAKFDMHFLHKNNLVICGRLFDTLLAAQLLDENRKNDLKSLSADYGFAYAKYTALSKYRGFSKDEILSVPLELAAEYAMNDVKATWALYQEFSQQLASEGLENVFNSIWMPLLPVLQQMEARGIGLDIEKVKEVRTEYVKKADELELRIRTHGVQQVLKQYKTFAEIPEYFFVKATDEHLEQAYKKNDGIYYTMDNGVETPIVTYDMWGKTKATKPRIISFNTGSSTQMQMLVFTWNDVRLPKELPLKKTKDGFSVDKDNLETLIYYNSVDTPEYLRDVLEWRKASKFITTYLDRFLADADPLDSFSISTSFNQAVGETGKGGAATGRLSSNGPNLQNIPSRDEVGKQARSMFVARKGYKLIVADYSQMELRMLAHYSQDPVLMQALREDKDLHIMTGASFAKMSYDELKAWYDEGPTGEHYEEAKKLRQLGKTGNFCVPLDTRILTKRGWLAHNEVVVGDETIGYDPELGYSRWTTVTDVHHFEDADLVRLSVGDWSVVCTPNHRWYGDKRSRWKQKTYVTEQFFTTDEITSETRLHLSHTFGEGGLSEVTPQEAAIIAWVWTDGGEERSVFTHSSSQGKYGHKTAFRARIFQKKHPQVATINRLLENVPHTYHIRESGIHVWELAPNYARALWQKAKIREGEELAFVLSLSAEAREAWLQASWEAEGYTNHGVRVISQNKGTLYEAMRVAIYLSGYRPTHVEKTMKHCITQYGKPLVTGQRMRKEAVDNAATWCVTTELGTWTAQQGKEIFLSGNSLTYGMGPLKFQRNLLVHNKYEVTLEQAEDWINQYNAMFAVASEWKQRVRNYVARHGYVLTIAGRKRRLPEIRSNVRWQRARAERQGVNAAIQGSCGDIICEAMIPVQAFLLSIGGSLLLQVHDELVAEVPEEHAEAAAHVIEQMMVAFINPRLRCPMKVDAHIGDNWGSAKG